MIYQIADFYVAFCRVAFSRKVYICVLYLLSKAISIERVIKYERLVYNGNN